MSHSREQGHEGHDGARIEETIPQELVHKHASTEVLLTDWTTQGDNRHTVYARWPHLHRFYPYPDRRFDPLLFVETVRQTFPLLSHVAYGVPFGSHLVWDDFSFEVRPEAMTVPQGPADVVLEITCTDVRLRRGCLVSMNMHAAVRLNGRHIGDSSTRFTNHSPAVYRRLRGEHDLAEVRRRAVPPPPPLPPAAVGHLLPENVVLAATERPDRWRLRADMDHPVLFDHPVDHAPGMLLLEALRQAAHAASPTADRVVTGMSVSFEGWVELDAAAWVSVAPLRGDVLRAVVEQAHGTCLTAEITLGPVPPARPRGSDHAPLQMATTGLTTH
ncbi:MULTISPECIES: ScbA/BarX family gamma-butyrolactone biosynthesis protein [unclassified Streptomyces]|uniref:ScbA/BarX family gamma-butyrolactone biosynthesis protein n=1 Tax=unclassified Streptomyces TaxID=2593676 RepID=UPI001661723F|nr:MULTISPECIES: ScbA/BarX family gamma-butyrolactone biosynthesis protein [unclassified Streptomyces]MBD0711484.1 transcriptional regulator [Streptomyces sp. CBMA291]MBD0716019.1 transcriptional regulator [Streptomyces sp. CBMA370]